MFLLKVQKNYEKKFNQILVKKMYFKLTQEFINESSDIGEMFHVYYVIFCDKWNSWLYFSILD